MIKNGDTVVYQGYTTDIITNLTLETLHYRDSSKPFCILYQHKAPHRNWMPAPRHMNLFQDKEFPLPSTFWDDIDAWELYDLKKDPEEINNIYKDASQQERIETLKKRLYEMRTELKVPDNI